MDIFFQNPDEVPLPPEEVRIRSLKADLYPDGRRLRITVETDPSQKPPSLEVTLNDASGDEIAQASIIENLGHTIEFTLHIRKPEALFPLTVTALLFFSAPIAPDDPQLPERMIADKVTESVSQ